MLRTGGGRRGHWSPGGSCLRERCNARSAALWLGRLPLADAGDRGPAAPPGRTAPPHRPARTPGPGNARSGRSPVRRASRANPKPSSKPPSVSLIHLPIAPRIPSTAMRSPDPALHTSSAKSGHASPPRPSGRARAPHAPSSAASPPAAGWITPSAAAITLRPPRTPAGSRDPSRATNAAHGGR